MTTLETRTEALRAQLVELYGLHCIPAWGTPRDPAAKTYGGKAAKFAAALGTPYMPWQRYVSDVALEVDPYTGLLRYDQVLLMVPRQSGKTTLELAVMAWRACGWSRQNILYTAQTRNAAREKWEEDHVPALESAPSIAKRIRRVVYTNGREAIKWHNRSRWGITSNTETAGHGPTLDMGVIDEAFSQEDSRTENAMQPAMVTRPQPQLWVVSTAGTEKSVYLNDKREAARRMVEEAFETGRPARIAVFDWTAEGIVDADGVVSYDRTDRRVWRMVMPALGHTITEERIQSRLETLLAEGKGAEFDRAYLNVTRTEVVRVDPNVPSAEWPDLLDEDSKRGPEIALAVDITPDRRWACIAVYSVRDDGLEHVEVIDHREGTNWVPARLRQLKARYNPVAIAVDAKGPAGALLLELEDDKAGGIARPDDPAKPRRGDLAVPTVQEVAAACAAFTDACRPPRPAPDDADQADDADERADVDEGQDVDETGVGTIRHIGQTPLNVAVANAISRPLGDAYAWGRRVSSGDISPLVAVTLARWAYRSRLPLVAAAYDPLANVW
ncbi:terminase large subunit domain-containing protein [Saccharothrix australiensis]|uniref:Terminase family protein n=1 Tax=Saccharothrix australiensis TaxID=2072 RepID=A0A495VIY9_9PSEU|nr:terminase family protein [Saccharothrix australiensis]RKT49351.1 terminase family protein [Saccharothrix australiensis]